MQLHRMRNHGDYLWTYCRTKSAPLRRCNFSIQLDVPSTSESSPLTTKYINSDLHMLQKLDKKFWLMTFLQGCSCLDFFRIWTLTFRVFLSERTAGGIALTRQECMRQKLLFLVTEWLIQSKKHRGVVGFRWIHPHVLPQFIERCSLKTLVFTACNDFISMDQTFLDGVETALASNQTLHHLRCRIEHEGKCSLQCFNFNIAVPLSQNSSIKILDCLLVDGLAQICLTWKVWKKYNAQAGCNTTRSCRMDSWVLLIKNASLVEWNVGGRFERQSPDRAKMILLCNGLLDKANRA